MESAKKYSITWYTHNIYNYVQQANFNETIMCSLLFFIFLEPLFLFHQLTEIWAKSDY